MPVRKPFPYFGGKQYMVKYILPLIPPHHTYCEVFGGSAAVLFAKPPSPVEVYNDIDSAIVDFYRVLRDPELFQQLHHKLRYTPYSRAWFYECRDTWRNEPDLVERVYKWYVVAGQSFSAYVHTADAAWSYNVAHSARGMASRVSDWLSRIDALPAFHQRLQRVQIEQDDFRKVIPRYDTPETCFYLDPPYVPDTRRHGRYMHEMSLDDHVELVNLLLNLQGMAILSGYRHAVYEPLERAGWRRLEVERPCCAVARTRLTGLLGKGVIKARQMRVECVWICPKTQARLGKQLPLLEGEGDADSRHQRLAQSVL